MRRTGLLTPWPIIRRIKKEVGNMANNNSEQSSFLVQSADGRELFGYDIQNPWEVLVWAMCCSKLGRYAGYDFLEDLGWTPLFECPGKVRISSENELLKINVGPGKHCVGCVWSNYSRETGED